MSTQPTRGKTTPASTAGSFATHAHGTSDVEISEESSYGEGWTRADSLQPGDRFLQEEPSRWDSDDPYVLVEVIGEKTPTRDRFGRAMFTYQCRRLDTGAEGSMMFGPEGMVRPAPPHTQPAAASPYDMDLADAGRSGIPAADVAQIAERIKTLAAQSHDRAYARGRRQEGNALVIDATDQDPTEMGRHKAWMKAAEQAHLDATASNGYRLSRPQYAGEVRDQHLRRAIEAARNEAIYASGDRKRRFRHDGDIDDHEWTTAYNAASVEAWSYFAVCVDEGGQPDARDVANVAAYVREWASEGPFLGGDPAPPEYVDLTNEYAHAVTGDVSGDGFWERRSVDRYRR